GRIEGLSCVVPLGAKDSGCHGRAVARRGPRRCTHQASSSDRITRGAPEGSVQALGDPDLRRLRVIPAWRSLPWIGADDRPPVYHLALQETSALDARPSGLMVMKRSDRRVIIPSRALKGGADADSRLVARPRRAVPPLPSAVDLRDLRRLERGAA